MASLLQFEYIYHLCQPWFLFFFLSRYWMTLQSTYTVRCMFWGFVSRFMRTSAELRELKYEYFSYQRYRMRKQFFLHIFKVFSCLDDKLTSKCESVLFDRKCNKSWINVLTLKYQYLGSFSFLKTMFVVFINSASWDKAC